MFRGAQAACHRCRSVHKNVSLVESRSPTHAHTNGPVIRRRVAAPLRGVGSDNSLPQSRTLRGQGGPVRRGTGEAAGRGHAQDIPGGAEEEVLAGAAGHAQQETYR